MTERRIPLILVFDSGVGGLSVFGKVRALLPAAQMIYAADNAAFPYGTKSEAEVIERVCTVVPHIARAELPDLVVLACNTASTVALEVLRQKLTVPVVGVVPAIKPAAEMSHSRVIGLLGTPGTVRRVYTQELIERFAADCVVIRHGSAELVEIAERKLQGEAIAPAEVQAVVDALRNQEQGSEMDVVVLACTHFPLLGAELAASAPVHVAWIDSGDAIARRVAFLLAELGIPTDGAGKGPARHRAIFTAAGPAVERLRGPLHAMGIDSVEILSLPARAMA